MCSSVGGARCSQFEAEKEFGNDDTLGGDVCSYFLFFFFFVIQY